MKNKIKAYFAGGWKHFWKIVIGGVLASLPIAATFYVVFWMYDQTSMLTEYLFSFILGIFGFELGPITIITTILGAVFLVLLFYVMGHFIETRVGNFIDKVLNKIPIYNFIKGIVDLFNDKNAQKKALVVYSKSYITGGYMPGVINSVKKGTISGHYTVVHNMTPIPSGGFPTELPANEIFVIKGAGYDDYIKYLAGMGTQTFHEMLKFEPCELGSENLPTLETWIENNLKEEEEEKIEENNTNK